MPSNKKPEIQRGQWGSAIEFFITSIGFAVGLGNVWRFPFKLYRNGGAVFLIPYTLALFFLAIPLQLLEASIGQFYQKGPVGVWDMVPLLKGVGIATVYSTFINIVYYNTPISWASFYFVRSMAAVLPWSWCDPEWATDPCTTQYTNTSNTTTNATSSGVMFFYRDALQITGDLLDWGPFVWPLFVSNFVLWVLLFAGTSFGAATLGKVSYFTSLFPYFMLVVMVGYTSSLPGSQKGIEFYLLRIDWKRLSDIAVWRDAVAQVFYSTNCGYGASIQLASYNKFEHNILRDAILIPVLDGLTSVLAGFSVFTVLGFMAQSLGVEVEDVVSSGPGLIFVTYAEVFSQIPFGNIWSVLFFFMVIILGLSSQFPLVEMCCSVVSDAFPWFNTSRIRNLALRVVVCLLGLAAALIFFYGSGYYWYFLIDELVASIALMIIALAELVGIGWFYSRPLSSLSGGHRLIHNIELMIGKMTYTKWYWIVTWTVIAPTALGFILLYDTMTFPALILEDYPWSFDSPSGHYEMPSWSVQIGWALVSMCPAIIAVVALWVACYEYGGYSAVSLALQPSPRFDAVANIAKRATSLANSKTEEEQMPHHEIDTPDNIRLPLSFVNGHLSVACTSFENEAYQYESTAL